MSEIYIHVVKCYSSITQNEISHALTFANRNDGHKILKKTQAATHLKLLYNDYDFFFFFGCKVVSKAALALCVSGYRR